MLKISWIAVCSLPVACSFGTGARESEWSGLDGVNEADCTPWPMREQDISVDRIFALGGKNPLWIVKTRERNGSVSNLLVEGFPRGADDLAAEKVKNLGARSIVGAAARGRDAIILVDESGGVDLIDATGKDIKVTRHAKLQQEVSSVTVSPQADMVMLAARSIDEDSFGAADPEATLKSAQASGKTQPAPNKHQGGELSIALWAPTGDMKSVDLPVTMRGVESPTILGSADGKVRLAFLSQEKDPATRSLVIAEVSASGLADRGKIPVKSGYLAGVDGVWQKPGTLIAYLDGNSLEGKSSLNIHYQTEEGSSGGWTKSFPLGDVHASPPRVVPLAGGNLVIMTKWVDGESTVATYSIVGDQVQERPHQGVFATGSAIVSAAPVAAGKTLAILVRSRVDDKTTHQLCMVKSPM